MHSSRNKQLSIKDPLPPTVLITGATSDIGRGLVHFFLEKNWRVFAHYNSSAKTARNLEQYQGTTIFKADLARPEGPENLAGQIIKKAGGKLDTLINNAALFEETPLEKLNVEDWENHLNINARAPLFLSQKLAALLADNNGSIINITDPDIDSPYPDYIPYMASKAALANITLSLARNLAPQVRVNAIAPGPIAFPDNFSDDERSSIINKTLLKRQGTPEEIAETAYFIATKATYSTGSTFEVTGG